jgi:hypothetical protein
MMMMLSDLSSEHEHEATGSSSYGGDMTSYALSPPLFLAPVPPPPPPQLEEPNKAAGTKRKRSQPGNPGT